MQTINLKQYYPFCTEDTFVEVSDEIVEAFLLDKRAEAARERKMYRYKAFYSLDCDDGLRTPPSAGRSHRRRIAWWKRRRRPNMPNCSGGSMRPFPLCPQRRPAASMPGICWG